MQRHTKFPLRQGCGPGIGKVIHAAVDPVTEIPPGLRVLVNEQRRIVQKGLPFESGDGLALPCVPGIRGQRVGRRSNCQKRHAEVLAESIPVILQEAGLWSPPHAERRLSIGHPGPVDALVKLRSQFRNARCSEVLSDGQNAVQKQRGVDGPVRRFARALAGIQIDEMRQKAMLVRHAGHEEFQRGFGSCLRIGARDPSPLGSHAIGSEPKADDRDAADACRLRAVRMRSSGYDPRLRISQIPEECERTVLEILEKGFIVLRVCP